MSGCELDEEEEIEAVKKMGYAEKGVVKYEELLEDERTGEAAERVGLCSMPGLELGILLRGLGDALDTKGALVLRFV